MAKKEKITVIVEETRTGYSAYVEGLENAAVVTTGKTLEELKSNMVEAMNLHNEHTGQELISEKDITFTMEKPKKKRGEKYTDKLKVNGSFLDIVKAAVKNADENSAKKK